MLPLRDLAEVTRGLIRHEDELTNQRMSAFLTVEGLLFAALAFGWDKSWLLVTFVLAPVGIAICASARATLIVGPRTIRRLVTTMG